MHDSFGLFLLCLCVLLCHANKLLLLLLLLLQCQLFRILVLTLTQICGRSKAGFSSRDRYRILVYIAGMNSRIIAAFTTTLFTTAVCVLLLRRSIQYPVISRPQSMILQKVKGQVLREI